MVYCCVPFCTSHWVSKVRKTPGVTFHQFPSRDDVRRAWIIAISRKEERSNMSVLWTPSDSSVVCRKHFTNADFKENTKIQCLKPTAVPSVFPGYPTMHKLPVPIIRKEVSEVRVVGTTNSPRTTREMFVDDDNNERLQRMSEVKKEPALEIRECVTCNTVCEQVISPLEPAVALPVNRPGRKKLPFSPTENKRRLKTLANHISRLKKRVGHLRMENKQLTESVQRRDESKLMNKVKRILADSEKEENVQAQFLCQQIQIYGKQNCRQWKECIVRSCVRWRAQSPKGYEYARRKKLFVLPGRSTLNKYADTCAVSVGNDVGVTTLAEPDLECEVVSDEDLFRDL